MSASDAIRVLVIDDQESIHEDFRKIVRSEERDDHDINKEAAALFGDSAEDNEPTERFEIDSAHQGEEGLAMVQEALRNNRPYPMAFVDVRMPPGWDGVETIQRIWEVDPEILIVLCTAYSDHTWEDIVARLGRTDHLLILKKPFDNIEVRQLVLALTKRWYLARQAEMTLNDLEQRVAVVSLVLLAGHLVIPLLGLISRHVKRNRLLLAGWALWMLVFHWIDLYWLVRPDLETRGIPIDVCCLIGLGGLYVAATVRVAARRSLVPLGDPRLDEALTFENS